MGVFFNWPDPTPPVMGPEELAQRSAHAGALVARAIRQTAEAVEIIERRRFEPPIEDEYERLSMLKTTIQDSLSEAAQLYLSMAADSRAFHVPVVSPARTALSGAVACSQIAGGALFRAALGEVSKWNGRSIMQAAFLMTKEASQSLETFKFEPSNLVATRQLAADMATLQVFGVVMSALFDRYASRLELER